MQWFFCIGLRHGSTVKLLIRLSVLLLLLWFLFLFFCEYFTIHNEILIRINLKIHCGNKQNEHFACEMLYNLRGNNWMIVCQQISMDNEKLCLFCWMLWKYYDAFGCWNVNAEGCTVDDKFNSIMLNVRNAVTQLSTRLIGFYKIDWIKAHRFLMKCHLIHQHEYFSNLVMHRFYKFNLFSFIWSFPLNLPIKYSKIIFQPITNATNSPTVTYEYMYAEPDVCGTRTPNSA